MNDSKTSDRIKRKRLLVLPLLTLPFITFGFWALGGGRGASPAGQASETLNLQLPAPSLKEGGENKLSFYELAAAAEKKRREALKADPYFRDTLNREEGLAGTDRQTTFWQEDLSFLPPHSLSHGSPGAATSADAQLLRKLEILNQEMERPVNRLPPAPQASTADGNLDQSIGRLEQMMQLMQERHQEDAEIDRLSLLMEQIKDIQHPQRLEEKGQANLAASKDSVLDVAVLKAEPFRDTGFYGLEMERFLGQTAIQAVMHGTQTLADGAQVKIRLLEVLYLKGHEIPEGTFVYGLAQLKGERLKINIPSLRVGQALFPVRLEVYDLDGLAGIHMPITLAGEVVPSASQKALQNIHLPIEESSIKTKATAAGLDAVKTFLSRKARKVKVTVADGYQLLIKTTH